MEGEQELAVYETLIEAMDDVAWVLDTDKTLTFVNDRITETLGVEPDAIIGQHFLIPLRVDNLAPADKLDAYETAIDRVLCGEQDTTRIELPLDLPSGHTIIDIRINPVTQDGQITGVVGIARDITERKQRGRKLEQQNARLEEFASIVSHDLRNPLQVADGRLELARDECDSDHLDDVVDAHERMDTLIEDLLTLARVGETAGEVTPVTLVEIIDNCWDTVAATEATLVNNVDSSRTIRANRSRLQQLFENLFRNTVEHGGDNVIVTVSELDNGFYVEDDGSGIPEDARDNIFEAGYSTSKEGTGFGLSIVEQVADAHNWNIRVTDGSDDGARFEIIGVETTSAE